MHGSWPHNALINAAQQRGSMSGRVLDASGLVLPGATVTVTEQGTCFVRTVVTGGRIREDQREDQRKGTEDQDP